MANGINAPFGLKAISAITGGDWSEKTNIYNLYTSDDGITTYDTNIFTGDPVQMNTDVDQIGTIAQYNPEFTVGTPSTFSETAILGVFQGCEYTDTTGRLVRKPYWPANTQVQAGSSIRAFIADDPDIVWEIQVSTSTDANNNAFTGKPFIPVENPDDSLAGSIGSNFGLNIGEGNNFDTITADGNPIAVGNPSLGYKNNPASGDTQTGRSAFYLDASTPIDISNNFVEAGDYNKQNVKLPLKLIGFSTSPENISHTNATLKTTPFLNVKVLINNHLYKTGNMGPDLS